MEKENGIKCPQEQNRCRKSCRLRWMNYLRPNIKKGCFSKDEVDLIIPLHKLLGNRWSLIAGRRPGRTANDVKNFWNTHIEKKLGGKIETNKSQKTITASNIIRPQPRTFSRFHVIEPISHTNQTNDWTSKDNNLKTKLQPSSSQDVDGCIKWWTSLLQETENITIEDHQISPDLFKPAEHDGLSSTLALDVDNWELVTFHDHDHSFLPFMS